MIIKIPTALNAEKTVKAGKVELPKVTSLWKIGLITNHMAVSVTLNSSSLVSCTWLVYMFTVPSITFKEHTEHSEHNHVYNYLRALKSWEIVFLPSMVVHMYLDVSAGLQICDFL